MFFETRATSKFFVARLARDSVFRVRTRRDQLAVATRLSTLMRHATFASFITASAYIPSRHRTRKIVYHVIMFLYTVIHHVNCFFGFYLSVENYVLAIQSSENDDPVLFEMFLESHMLVYSPTVDRSIPVVSRKRLTMGRVISATI